MKPHKHAELIKAWADGAEIQINVRKGDDWEDINPKCVVWADEYEYRIKPDPKPDIVSYYRSENYQLFYTTHNTEASLKVKWDGETGKLKSAEVLK